MAADVVGYSRLMSHDEVGTLRRLKDHRAALIDPAIAVHHGRIVKATGDGLLLEFASVVHAVACAIAVQRGMHARNQTTPPDARIVLRIGINIGDIIIDGDDIFGDGVNIAARLEGISTPGGVCISDISYHQVRDKLPLAFVDLGEQSVKNIARPVRCYGMDEAAIVSAPALVVPGSQRTPRRALLLAGAAVALGAAGGGAAWVIVHTKASAPPLQAVPLPGRQQMAVLPLLTIGGGETYFADGLTEDLIVALGRFSEIAVRARSAVSVYKDHPASPAEIGRTLSVRYVVEGSVQRAPDRLRVAVRLIEANLGTVVWSNTYDTDAKDVFAVQDDITRRIAGAISVRLDALAFASAATKPPERLEAYDLVLRARSLLNQEKRVGTSQARALLEHAITLDPNFAAAYVELGRADLTAMQKGWTDDPAGTLLRANAHGRRAVELQDDNAGAHALLGRALAAAEDYDAALDELKRAIALNPSDAETLASYGEVLTINGEVREAISAMEEAAQFRPSRPDVEFFYLGLAYLLAGRPADTARVVEKGVANSGNLPDSIALLAAAYAELGRTADATREADDLRRNYPRFESKDAGSLLRRPQDRESLRAAFRQAGL
jgi:TolB-like protein/Flp pilus assembly protein TadD